MVTNATKIIGHVVLEFLEFDETITINKIIEYFIESEFFTYLEGESDQDHESRITDMVESSLLSIAGFGKDNCYGTPLVELYSPDVDRVSLGMSIVYKDPQTRKKFHEAMWRLTDERLTERANICNN